MTEQDGGAGRDDDPSRAFGNRVRELRDAAGLTLEQLSQRSGVSRAMLSKVERGEKSPTIGIATKIAHSLETSLSELIGANPSDGAAVVLRRTHRPIFCDPETGFERHVVSAATGVGRVELVFHHLPPGVSTGTLPAYPAGTEKQVVVVEGRLTVQIRGVSEQLEPGDSLFFRANVEHAFVNQTAASCGYYMVVSRGN
jgi:transcriptional regulator with XRE-family HTH domain